MPSEVKPRSERNAGKRWSTLDKRDLTDALARGDSLTDAASFLLRPVDVVRYSFIVRDLHPLLFAGLPAH
jgi:hypothetical protein